MGGCVSVEIEEDQKPKPGPRSSIQEAPKPAVEKQKTAEHKKNSAEHKRATAEHKKSTAEHKKGTGNHSGDLGSKKQSSKHSVGSAKSEGDSKKSTGSKKSGSSSAKSAEDFVLPPAVEDDGSGIPPAKRLKLKDLQVATNEWDETMVLGEGSFGKVYKGVMDEMRGDKGSGTITRIDVAVKKLNPSSFQGYDEWLAEVLFLDKLRHINLVRLVGYCAENGEALLAYELCHKGSLDDVFFSEKEDDLFTWEQRVKVALDAAQGLAYLHESNVIHRDFKPSNILLDTDMNARLTDFGMAKEGPEGGETHISTRVMGTLGYLDPAYMQTGRLTRKSDTYSYGIMLLELISGRRSQEENLTKWARPLLAQRKPDVQQLVDPRLEDKYSKPGATKMAILAKHCIDDDPVSRPEMKVLVESLKRILKE